MFTPSKTITSRSNAAFKLLQEITSSSRARLEHQSSWIEGERLCQAYLQSGAPPAIAVMTEKGYAGAARIIDCHPNAVRETWLIDEKLFSLMSPVESSVGWGLLIPIPRSGDLGEGGDVVVLDRIQDPGNLGTIMRSAVGAGVSRLWCTAGTTDPWSPKALRSAMGAHFALKIAIQLDDSQVIQAAQAQRLQLLATAPVDHALSLFDRGLNLQPSCAWVFGNEAGGISEALLSQAQRIVIPQSTAIESLNVAAAASICLFEMRRRRI